MKTGRRLCTVPGDVGVPNQFFRITPFVMVIVVLALVGRTRIPSAAGDHYESGEE